MRDLGRTVSGNRILGSVLSTGVLVWLVGCHKPGPATIINGQAGVVQAGMVQAGMVQDSGPDPADANMAPVNGTYMVYAPPGQASYTQAGAPRGGRATNVSQGAAPRYAQNEVAQSGQAPAPIERREPQGSLQGGGDSQAQGYPQGQGYPAGSAPTADSYDDPSYDPGVDAGMDAIEEADQPPPPLPVYEQPETPGPNYLWTPGYWSYAPAGYFWVPGAWCAAPYPGALWTPGYWGSVGNRYRFHHGFWGLHIGFYGGIPYGFGYTGRGYEGGYWRGNDFFYNRSVNRINVTRITNVYNRTVVVNNSNNYRVSYNGGRGGIQARPAPAEIAALRGPRMGAMRAQLQNRHEAETNRQQFFSENRGRPAVMTASRPFGADRQASSPGAPIAGTGVLRLERGRARSLGGPIRLVRLDFDRRRPVRGSRDLARAQHGRDRAAGGRARNKDRSRTGLPVPLTVRRRATLAGGGSLRAGVPRSFRGSQPAALRRSRRRHRRRGLISGHSVSPGNRGAPISGRSRGRVRRLDRGSRRDHSRPACRRQPRSNGPISRAARSRSRNRNDRISQVDRSRRSRSSDRTSQIDRGRSRSSSSDRTSQSSSSSSDRSLRLGRNLNRSNSGLTSSHDLRPRRSSRGRTFRPSRSTRNPLLRLGRKRGRGRPRAVADLRATEVAGRDSPGEIVREIFHGCLTKTY